MDNKENKLTGYDGKSHRINCGCNDQEFPGAKRDGAEIFPEQVGDVCSNCNYFYWYYPGEELEE